MATLAARPSNHISPVRIILPNGHFTQLKPLMLPPQPSSQLMPDSYFAKTTEAIRKALPQVLPSHLSPNPPTCTAFPSQVPTLLVSINPAPKDTTHSPSCLHHHFLPLGRISPINVRRVLFLPFLSNATSISPPSKIK